MTPATHHTTRSGMWNAIAATMVFLGALSCGPQQPSDSMLYGVWSGDHAGRRLVFSFLPDKTCELRFEDTNAGSVTVWTGNFDTDLTKSPVPMSIRNIPQLGHPLHTIVRFDTDDTLIVAPFAVRWRLRPIAFDKERSMKFVRLAESQL